MQEAKRIKQAHILVIPWHLGRLANSYCTVAHAIGTTERTAAILPNRHFSESHFHMKQAYLLLASERRVLNVVLDDDPDAIQRAIGTRLSNTAPRSKLRTSLLSAATNSAVSPRIRFWAAGVPFSFHGNALLVGIDPLTGDTASRPQMTIDEFQRLITFATPSHDRRLSMVFPEALEESNLRGGR